MVSKAPAYVILGRGRWAKRMHPLLTAEERVVSRIEETRQRLGENESSYVARLAEAMKASRAEIAWLCVLPGPHVSRMTEAALEAGLHVLVEKPWFGSEEDTQRLQALARGKGRLLAVHFEYLVLGEVEGWKAMFYPGVGMHFGGRFFLRRADSTGMSALDNLGCHLAAIREFTVPASGIAELQCSYERADERIVWLERTGQCFSSIDLLRHGQPIIQRFLRKVEAALEGAAFPFDLNFALRVENQLNARRVQKSP